MLKTLLTSWFTSPPRGGVLKLQRILWIAVAREAATKQQASIYYDPTQDVRVQWAVQHIQSLHGLRARPDPAVAASAEFALGLAHYTHCPATSDP